MELAIELAAKSRCKQQHAAVIVYRGKILATGVNQKLECPTTTNWRNNYIHAEEAAILKAGGNIPRGAKIYIARVGGNGSPANSAPCTRCYGRITRAGIKEIAFT